jgi:hypothetical protein
MTNLYWLIFLVYSKLYCCLYCVFSESDNLFIYLITSSSVPSSSIVFLLFVVSYMLVL